MAAMDEEYPSTEDLAILRAAFEPDEPLGWDGVRAFEAEQGIVLPEPYRTFVAEICDGSTFGLPDLGLIELGRLPEDWGQNRPTRVLSEPFPLTDGWIWESEDRSAEELKALLGPVHNHGSLVLGTEGCGMYWHLIITGAHRGHVWCITDVGAYPFGAEFGTTTGRSGFAGWVEHWHNDKPWEDDL